MSNVNTAQEFTDLISMQRAFQLNSKGFSVADEMWSMINKSTILKIATLSINKVKLYIVGKIEYSILYCHYLYFQ